MLWYDIPIGALSRRPDFLILHPRRRLLVVEGKDCKLESIVRIDKLVFRIRGTNSETAVANPLEQARYVALAIADRLKTDRHLTRATDAHQGKLIFLWRFGVDLTDITRRRLTESGLGEVIPEGRAICADEMTDRVDAEVFQQRRWEMFPYPFGNVLSLPEIDRIRSVLFPEIRIAHEAALFESATAGPRDSDNIIRVM